MSGLKDLMVRRLLRERMGFRIKWMIRYGQDLRLPVGPRPEAKIPLAFRQLGEEDLPLFTRLVGSERLPELRERLRQGHITVGAFHQDRLVGFNWENPHEAYDESTGIQFPLKPGEIYSYNKLVDPAYRNLGVGGQLGWENNQILAARGYRQKIGFADFHNFAQRKSIAKVGSRRAGHLIFLQVFGHKVWLSLPMRKAGATRMTIRVHRQRTLDPASTQGAP